MEINYQNIKSLIKSEIWEGNQVKLKFKASNQEQEIETLGMAMPSQDEIMKKVMAEMAKSAASNIAINTASNAIGSFTGTGNLAGTIANEANLGYQMDSNSFMQVNLTEEIKQETVVSAFAALQVYYEHNGSEWVYKTNSI